MRRCGFLIGLLLAVPLLGACQATVQKTPGMETPEAIVAELPRMDLKVGYYMTPAARRFAVDETWARFTIGQDIDANATTYLTKVFREVRPLAAFPTSPESVRGLDLVVTVDGVGGNFKTLDLLTHGIDASADFSFHTPDGKLIRRAPHHSEVQVFMGSLNPSDNIRAGYEGAETVARDLVLKFIQDIPQAEIAEAAANYQPVLANTPAAGPAAPKKPRFRTMFLSLKYPKGPARPDDIAVVIGNADYTKLGKNIPDVTPAYSDAASFKRYAIRALGIRPGNVIDLRDATSAQLERVFGSERTHKGQLFDWVRPGRSKVWVYYAGHGAPAGGDGTAYLVPSDADGARIEINGYPLSTLYANLSQIPAQSVTVVLEACFSGASQGGSVIAQASPIFLAPKAPPIPAGITVIAAGAPNQMASWEEDKSHGLFTKYYLTGMSGRADTAPYGNGDGTVDFGELKSYLEQTLTYYARRYYGRDQTARIVIGGGN